MKTRACFVKVSIGVGLLIVLVWFLIGALCQGCASDPGLFKQEDPDAGPDTDSDSDSDTDSDSDSDTDQDTDLDTGTCLSGEIEAEDPDRVSWSDGFFLVSGIVLHNGAALYTDDDKNTESLIFDFYGSGLVVHYTAGPDRGDISISIDGELLSIVDCWNFEYLFQVPASAGGLVLKYHTAVIRCIADSGFCGLDYFEIVCD